jgi:hypothetical protein
MAISPLPDTPTRGQVRDDLVETTDAFLAALPLFVIEANATAVEVNTARNEATTAALLAQGGEGLDLTGQGGNVVGVNAGADALEFIEVVRPDQLGAEALAYRLKPIGEPFPIWDHIAGVNAPDNSGAAKFIRLTAGQSGSGGYNEGLLTDESVSGSAPLIEADAEIAVGPMEGERVPLLNTEGAFIRPGTSSGTLQMDQMQEHRHFTGVVTSDNTADNAAYIGEGHTLASDIDRRSTTARVKETTSGGARRFGATSGPISTDQTIGYAGSNNTFPEADQTNARKGNETRPKNRQATYYMRIV